MEHAEPFVPVLQEMQAILCPRIQAEEEQALVADVVAAQQWCALMQQHPKLPNILEWTIQTQMEMFTLGCVPRSHQRILVV
jgi:hypothetical protein